MIFNFYSVLSTLTKFALFLWTTSNIKQDLFLKRLVDNFPCLRSFSSGMQQNQLNLITLSPIVYLKSVTYDRGKANRHGSDCGYRRLPFSFKGKAQQKLSSMFGSLVGRYLSLIKGSTVPCTVLIW